MVLLRFLHLLALDFYYKVEPYNGDKTAKYMLKRSEFFLIPGSF